ncbi:MAG: hypothetical protein HYT98_04360 [Candidatus Sungbacteria bacterium]|nr:hypothetical protein [Candidatus Sungbacteria bacterium]
MKGKSVFWWAVLLVCLFVGVASAQVDAPQYKEGDAWKIKYKRGGAISKSNVLLSGIYDVVYRNGEFVWCPSQDDKSIDNKLCADPWTGLLAEALFFVGDYGKDNPPFFSFPIKVGDKPRGYEYFNPNAGRSGMNSNGTIAVTDVSTKTKAGEYNAYKHSLSESGGRTIRTYYYVSECKCVLEFSAELGSGTTYSGEVLDFKVAK